MSRLGYTFILGALALMTTSGCMPSGSLNPESDSDQRKELVTEFNSVYKITLKTTGTPLNKFKDAASEPIDTKQISADNYEPLHVCDYSGNGKNKWWLDDFVYNISSRSTKDVEQKIERMSKIWREKGLQVHDMGTVDGVSKIVAKTDSGLTLDYTISTKMESIKISTFCTEILDAENR